jgi:hypothetical protein
MLDHVTKNNSGSKYAYGSERKATGAHVHIGFKQLEPFARGTTGRTLLTTHKDRPGYLPRPVIGRLILDSDGEHVTYRLEADQSRTGDAFRPTNLMEKVSRHLEGQHEHVPRREIERSVTGNAAAKRTAIDVLVDEGYARQTDGPGRAKLVEHVRPYREADDELERLETLASESASQVRPGCVPDLVSKRSARVRPCVPP